MRREFLDLLFQINSFSGWNALSLLKADIWDQSSRLLYIS